jgi:hypothetical protein
MSAHGQKSTWGSGTYVCGRALSAIANLLYYLAIFAGSTDD